MTRTKLAKRLISITLAAAMVTPLFATMAEAVVGTWLSPKPGERVSAREVEVSVGYNTESDVKVTRLELWIDGKFYDKKVLLRPQTRGVCSFWWDTTRTPQGAHDLEVRIYAGNEFIATVSGTGTIGQGGYDLRPPTVRFANIKAGDVLSGTAKIALTASDDSGKAPIVSLIVDSALKLLTNKEPYVCELDTTQYSNGSHELQSVAYDAAGNKSDPAVVKVAFKNNLPQAVAANTSVGPTPSGTPASEDDGVGAMLPPVRETAPKAESARSSEPGTALTTSAPQARPVGHVRESAISPAEPRVAPAESVAVRTSPTASEPSAEVMTTTPSIVVGTASHGPSAATAVEPSVEPTARAAANRSEARVVAIAPEVRGRHAERRSEPSAGSYAEPEAVRSQAVRAAPPTVSERRTVSSRSQVVASAPASSGAVEPRTIDAPVASSAGTVAVSSGEAAVRTARVSHAPRVMAAMPDVPFIGHATASSPCPVKVAMLPSIRGGYCGIDTRGTIARPPSAKPEVRARIEKRTLPASGKVKLRDLFDQLGGLLFWDASTHTVTGYLDGMTIEMHIGSGVVKVDGVQMPVATAPVVVRGRTVIDAGLLRQARAFAVQHAQSARAQE